MSAPYIALELEVLYILIRWKPIILTPVELPLSSHMMASCTILRSFPSTILALAGFSSLTAHILLYRHEE